MGYNLCLSSTPWKRLIHYTRSVKSTYLMKLGEMDFFVFATKARCHIVWCNEIHFSGVVESSRHFKHSARSREGNANVTACKTTKVFTSAHFCSTLRHARCSICFLFSATALFVMFAWDLLIVISGLFWATDQIVQNNNLVDVYFPFVLSNQKTVRYYMLLLSPNLQISQHLTWACFTHKKVSFKKNGLL